MSSYINQLGCSSVPATIGVMVTAVAVLLFVFQPWRSDPPKETQSQAARNALPACSISYNGQFKGGYRGAGRTSENESYVTVELLTDYGKKNCIYSKRDQTASIISR